MDIFNMLLGQKLSGESNNSGDNSSYIEIIPSTKLLFEESDLATLAGWGVAVLENVETPLIEDGKEYLLIIDDNEAINVVMTYNEDTESYVCGNTLVIIGQDNGEDYALEISPNGIGLMLRNVTGKHSMELKYASNQIEELEQLIDKSGVLDTEGSVSEKVEKLIDKAEWENVWYKASENIVNANYLFQRHQGKTIPRTNLINATSCGNFIKNSSIEYIDYYLDTKKVTSFQYGFAYAESLKRMKGVNTSNASQVNGIFMSNKLLETIEEPFDFSKVTQNMGLAFNGCSALKNIRFVKECIKISMAIPSPVLSAESIQSIIDGLATVTTAQTLTLHSAITLTDEQKATIKAKGWTLVQ